MAVTEPHRRAKVAMLVTRMDIGGVPDHIMTLLSGLSRAFDFTLICDHVLPVHAERLSALGIKFQELKMSRTLSPLADFRSLRQLRHILKEEQIDLVHTHTSKAALLGALAARLLRRPVSVNTAHNLGFIAMPNPMVKVLFWLYDRALFALGTDAVIVVSQFVEQRVLTARLIARKKLHVIHNGILEANLHRRELVAQKPSGDVNNIICVARLVWFKGLHTLIDAMPQIVQRHPKTLLKIAGDGELEGALRQQVKKLGMGDYVEFLGLRLDVPHLLTNADIFVLPSVSEGLPISILEAMTTGLPVVATRVGGVPELVEEGVTGFVVPPENPGELARAVNRLLDNPALCLEMGRSAQMKAAREFSATSMQERTADLYQALLKKGTGAASK
jgi:glycosyltransferase involved in cell wall biosynthesis